MIHLGDHDPSGWDMTRDNEERLELIAGFNVEVIRVALSTSQVKQYKLPPQPAKISDKRYAKYAAEYGTSSWELDALRPKVIDKLISDAIESCIENSDLWQETLNKEAERRKPLAMLHSRWQDIKAFLDKPESLEPDNYYWEP